MSLYLPASGQGAANPGAFAHSMMALDLVPVRLFGNGILSGLTVDGTGAVQTGEALIGHIVAVTAPATPSYIAGATNYVYLQVPPMPTYVLPAQIPPTGDVPGVVGADGRDVGTIVVNTTGVQPVSSVLLATVVTNSGGAVTSVNTAPTGRVNIVLPSQLQSVIGNLKHKSAYVPGSLPVTAGILKLRVPFAWTVTKIKAAVSSAPVGSSMVIDLKKNGTSVFSTTGSRLTIAAGATSGTSAQADNAPGCVEGDILSVDITQAGSTTPATDLMLTLYYT